MAGKPGPGMTLRHATRRLRLDQLISGRRLVRHMTIAMANCTKMSHAGKKRSSSVLWVNYVEREWARSA